MIFGAVGSVQSAGPFSKASGGWAREDEEDGGKALTACQEEDGRQKPIRQPRGRVPSSSQLFRPLEDQDKNAKKKGARRHAREAHHLRSDGHASSAHTDRSSSQRYAHRGPPAVPFLTQADALHDFSIKFHDFL